MKKTLTFLSNIFIGIPGGFVIFMGMLMFNALLDSPLKTNPWTMLFILCFTSIVVGLFARLIRPIHGFGAAVASGCIAAGIILYLRLSSSLETGSTLVFGPLGMVVVIGFSALGGWSLPYLRKQSE